MSAAPACPGPASNSCQHMMLLTCSAQQPRGHAYNLQLLCCCTQDFHALRYLKSWWGRLMQVHSSCLPSLLALLMIVSEPQLAHCCWPVLG